MSVIICYVGDMVLTDIMLRMQHDPGPQYGTVMFFSEKAGLDSNFSPGLYHRLPPKDAQRLFQ